MIGAWVFYVLVSYYISLMLFLDFLLCDESLFVEKD